MKRRIDEDEDDEDTCSEDEQATLSDTSDHNNGEEIDEQDSDTKQNQQLKKQKVNKMSSTKSESLKKKTSATTTTTKESIPKKKPNATTKRKDDTIVQNFANNSKTSRDKETGLIELQVSTPAKNMNQLITDILSEVGIFEKNKGAQHKYNAYRKAIQSIKAYPSKLKSGKESQKLDGVGLKIAKKVQEIIDTGSLKKLEKLKSNETLVAINDISRVSGIGPVIAKELVMEKGVKNIDDMKKIAKTLNHHQQVGLKHFDDIEQRVPRDEIEIVESIVSHTLGDIDEKILAQTVGSYRRGLPNSGDIDILITHPDAKTRQKLVSLNILEKVVDKLTKKGVIVDDISMGPMKYMGCCICPNKYRKQRNEEQENEEEYHEEAIKDDDDDSSETEPEDDIVAEKMRKKKQDLLNQKKLLKKKKPSTTTTTNNNNNNNNSHGKEIVRRIDLKLVPITSYYFALLHTTGSDEFNRQMRGVALSKGLTLSEYSIKPLKKSEGGEITVGSEKEIFDIIGLRYYAPNERSL